MVFLAGAGMSAFSLTLACMIPRNPTPENNTMIDHYKTFFSTAK
jgi:hypothetical protein